MKKSIFQQKLAYLGQKILVVISSPHCKEIITMYVCVRACVCAGLPVCLYIQKYNMIGAISE